jgi:hypothetical protein
MTLRSLVLQTASLSAQQNEDAKNAMKAQSQNTSGGGQKTSLQALENTLESSDGVHRDTIPLCQFQTFVSERSFLAEYFGHVFGVSFVHTALYKSTTKIATAPRSRATPSPPLALPGLSLSSSNFQQLKPRLASWHGGGGGAALSEDRLAPRRAWRGGCWGLLRAERRLARQENTQHTAIPPSTASNES